MLEIYAQEPNDPFNIYFLALEYAKTDKEKSRAFFEKLLHEHADYHASYYHAAALFTELGLYQMADDTYKKGIALCQKKDEAKALKELQAAYDNFKFELED